MIISEDKKAKALAKKWANLKAQEEVARLKRLGVESEILAHLGDRVPANGTLHVDGGIRIVTGATESWDQYTLREIEENWTGKGAASFPFRVEWKPNNPAIKTIRESEPKLWERLEPALRVTEKKPSFSIE